MTDEPRTHCLLCYHPLTSHPQDADGNRPCRSIDHPEGVPCHDCQDMLTTEYRSRVADERDTAAFEQAYAAYLVTLADVQRAFGDAAWAYFTDVHQSALASALIAYRKQQEGGLKAALELIRDFVDPNSCTYDNLGYCQTHDRVVGTEPSCTHARARTMLAELNALENKESPCEP